MKKFLTKIAFILLLGVSVFAFFDYYITTNLHYSDARMFRNWNEVLYDTTYYDLIINGSSRAWHFYNPQILDSILGCNCYNLGLDGHQITSQIARYNVYSTYHRHPKYLVQNIDFFTLTFSTKFEREQFLPYLYVDTLFNQIHQEEGFSYIDKYIPFLRYIGYRDVIFEGFGWHNDIDRVPHLYKGFATDNRTWNIGERSIDSLTYFCCETECARLFENYLAQLRQDSIQVVLVYGPVYRGDLNKDPSPIEKEMYAYFQQCADKYGCTILNYMWHDICADKKYFYNATHINKMGSDIISVRLAYDLDSLGFIDNFLTQPREGMRK